jgi:flagellar hook assembly protein FlgD
MASAEKKSEDSLGQNAKVVVQDIKVAAEDALKTVKEAIREGNVRRITVKDKEGRVVATFPLAVGVVGVVLAPVLAAIGALTAILTDCTLSIEKSA